MPHHHPVQVQQLDLAAPGALSLTASGFDQAARDAEKNVDLPARRLTVDAITAGVGINPGIESH
jgi:hypothetical protein